MKQFMALIVLIFVGVVGWRIGERLSSDALGIALGVLFGVMAGIPFCPEAGGGRPTLWRPSRPAGIAGPLLADDARPAGLFLVGELMPNLPGLGRRVAQGRQLPAIRALPQGPPHRGPRLLAVH